MTALIDGVAFTGSAVGVHSIIGGVQQLQVAGTNAVGANGTTLTFLVPASVGTHAIAVGSGSNANLLILANGVATGYLAVQNSGSGSVTVATHTVTDATGTFSFVMPSTTGGPPKTIANGTFNVTF